MWNKTADVIEAVFDIHTHSLLSNVLDTHPMKTVKSIIYN